MLPVEKLIKSNFVDGIKFNPQQIGLSSEYFDQKLSLLNLYGVGRGVLVGFMDSLELVIENDNLVLKSGACIDASGNMIFVDREYIVLTDIHNEKYQNRSWIYIYISYEKEMMDLESSRDDKNVKIYYTIGDKYQVSLAEKMTRDKNLVELGRVYIKHNTSTVISNPINPFDAKENEIDITHTNKLVGQNILTTQKERFAISDAISKYGYFLHEFGFRKSLFSMSTVASFAHSISHDIRDNPQITTWQIYQMLIELLNISLKIEIEREDITNTALWKNLVRLKSIFAFQDKFKVSYYALYLNIDNSFFSKVILHFINATVFDGDWENILESKSKEEEKRDYIIVGSGVTCDMRVEGEDISEEQAKIYIYMRQDTLSKIYQIVVVYMSILND